MNEILSQKEIDNLLSAVELGDFGGEADSGMGAMDSFGSDFGFGDTGGYSCDIVKSASVKMYDFKRPDKFNNNQLRGIQRAGEQFGRFTTTSFTQFFRTFAHVHVASVDQLTFEEFSRSIPNPTTLAMINMDPLNGQAILEIDPTIAFSMLDRLFGGEGDSLKENRQLTDIELSIMEGVVIRMLGNLRAGFKDIIDLRPKLRLIENNIQFAQIAHPNDMVILITLETRIGDIEGMMNLCIPYLTLESIMDKLCYTSFLGRKKNITEEMTDQLLENVEATSLEISAVIGRKKISIRDIQALDTGSEIHFNKD